MLRGDLFFPLPPFLTDLRIFIAAAADLSDKLSSSVMGLPEAAAGVWITKMNGISVERLCKSRDLGEDTLNSSEVLFSFSYWNNAREFVFEFPGIRDAKNSRKSWSREPGKQKLSVQLNSIVSNILTCPRDEREAASADDPEAVSKYLRMRSAKELGSRPRVSDRESWKWKVENWKCTIY
jgi:hypothetical protein